MAPGVLSYKAEMEEDDAFEPEDGLDEPRGAQPAPSRGLRSKSRVDYTAQLAPDPEAPKQPSRPSRILNSGARMRAAAKISTPAAQATPMPQDTSKSCGFLDILPAELRNRIYELVLGNSTIHIYTDLIGWDSNFEVYKVPLAPNDERILCDFCSAEDEEESHIEKIQAQDPAEAHHDEHDKRHILCRGRGSATDAFALLQTCRQIHSEAALIPFLSNTFSFFDLITLDQFLRRLIPKQARAIQHISFTINSDSSFPDPPIRTDWKRLLGGELESLICIAEFVGDREEGFEESGKDCAEACMAFRNLMVKDLKVLAYNVYEDEDDELVTAKELNQWAKEVEEKLKVSAKDEPQKKAGKGKRK